MRIRAKKRGEAAGCEPDEAYYNGELLNLHGTFYFALFSASVLLSAPVVVCRDPLFGRI